VVYGFSRFSNSTGRGPRRHTRVSCGAVGAFKIQSGNSLNDLRGLKLANAHGFDLFIFDSMLPDGSGVELCRRVRKFNQRTPIIFYSGLAYETDITKALAAGAQAYLVKPVDVTDLIQSVENLIGKAADSQSLEKKLSDG
jgi:FOG: CheY-like receiver